MLFSAKAEYACLAMLELAAQYGDPKPVPLTEIANKHGISSLHHDSSCRFSFN